MMKRNMMRLMLLVAMASPAMAQPSWVQPSLGLPGWQQPQWGRIPDMTPPSWGQHASKPIPLPAPEIHRHRHHERQSSWTRTRWNFNVNVNVPALLSPALLCPTMAGSAVEAGRDIDGQTVYAAVAEIDGRLMPGKAKAPFTICNVGFGGVEHEVSNFQLIAGNGYHWVDCSPMNIPCNAVAVGPDQDGTTLYVARGQYMGNWVAGKYRAGAQFSLVPFGGSERPCFRFQVLVCN